MSIKYDQMRARQAARGGKQKAQFEADIYNTVRKEMYATFDNPLTRADYIKVLVGVPLTVGLVWGFAVFVMIGG